MFSNVVFKSCDRKIPGVGRPHPRMATGPGTRRASFQWGARMRRGAISLAPFVGQPISLVLYTKCLVSPSKAIPQECFKVHPSP